MPISREIIREQSHPPQLPALSWSDRLALHAGVALIRWAERPQQITRPTSSESFESIVARRELVQARHQIGLNS